MSFVMRNSAFLHMHGNRTADQHLNFHYIDSYSLVCDGPVKSCENRAIPLFYLSRVMRKPALYLCENKDADQLRGKREADQRLCFRYTDSTIPLLPKYKISSL